MRFLLVSLVAGMGFELPSSSDVASWTQASRDWVDARMGDLMSLKVEAERAFAEAADCEREAGPVAAPVEVAADPTPADLAFEAVVEKMASDFAADLAAIEEPEPAAEALVKVESFQEMPPAVWTESEPVIPTFEKVAEARPEVVIPTGDEATQRVEKLSTAVQLTRQALNAWASLFQPAVQVAAEEANDTR